MPANRYGAREILFAESMKTATKRGEAWTAEEDDLLRSIDGNQYDMLAAAQLIHRTMAATVVRFYKVRTADRTGKLIRYADRNPQTAYPEHRTRHIQVMTWPACACADPWEHRDWCPDGEQSTEQQAA